ncbi:MAG TPA: hypothetical protein VF286_14360 [Acidiphilium sp.]
MSGTVTVIGGVNNGTLTGLVTIPAAGTPAQISALQSVLNFASSAIESGSTGMTNDNVVAGSVFNATLNGSSSNLLEITNSDSVNGTTSGSYSGPAINVASVYGSVIVQAPGTVSVNGNGNNNSTYLFGSASNVTLTTQDGTSGASIIAAGGNDVLNLRGNNTATITGGSDITRTYTGSNTVFATGDASVYSGIRGGYAGKLDFINNSTAAATVVGGAGSATVFGGTGGGVFYGGTAGNNSLVGGTGNSTLVGGGNNDTLQATGAGSSNDLFAGSGNETLFASSVTGTNILVAAGGTDSLVGSGTGYQYFFGGTGSATMTGSANISVTGAKNIYFFGQAGGAGGGSDVITNFNTNSALFVTNGNDITTITGTTVNGINGALVSLSDGTKVTLMGVNASSISQYSGGKYIG